MIDFKKMEEKDFVFINKKLNEKEEQEFSAFLKSRKTSSQKSAALKPVRQ